MKARRGSERRGSEFSISHPQSQSGDDVSSAQSETSSTQSAKSLRLTSAASDHDKVKVDPLRVSEDMKSERSSSRGSNHYSEEFDEPSVASSTENLGIAVLPPTKAKKFPPL